LQQFSADAQMIIVTAAHPATRISVTPRNIGINRHGMKPE
jgi:hypothetical protein